MDAGDYPFLDYGSLTNNSPTFKIMNSTFSTLNFSVDEGIGGQISLDVQSLSATKTWAGSLGANGNLWDIATTLNWSGSAVATTYTDSPVGDIVVFNNTATVFGVTLNSHVNPSAVIFANTPLHSYVLNGTGGIDTSAGGVLVNGGGTVTFNNNNAYNSTTSVSNGSTFVVNGNLSASPVIVDSSFLGGSGTLGGTLSLKNTSSLAAGSNLTVNGATASAAGPSPSRQAQPSAAAAA